MNLKALFAGVVSVAFATACFADCQANGCVKASSFGWNAEDATAALQAAFDSGARRVVVDNVGAPWNVRPVVLRRSNLEVVVADGVTVLAKKGAFKRVVDSLLTVGPGVTNVVLRGEGTATLAMRKRDYDDAGGHRHTVSIIGGCNVTVRDLTILSSGGDGVYVRAAARNVHLDRLVCRDHFRQGISVISAVGLRVTNCVFDETSGTAPQCGVDLEPNTARDRLEDIVFEDCTFNGNAASGIHLHLVMLDDTTPPISITFRRCVSRGNANHGVLINAAGTKSPVRGTISFEDCTVSGNLQSALVLARKACETLPIVFRNCSLDARGGKAVPVKFDNGSYLSDFGGVEFDNVRVLADNDRAFSFNCVQGAGIAASTMKGVAVVETAGSSKTVALSEFSRAYPQNPEAMRVLLSFKTETPNFRSLVAAPGVKRLDAPASTGWFRGRFIFVQYVPAAGDYPIVFRMKPLGGRKPGVKVQVLDEVGTSLGMFSAEGTSVTNVIHAKGACIRRFEVDPMSGLATVESPWPGQGVQSDVFVHPFAGVNRRFWFAVPADAESVRVQVQPEEPCSARLLRPDGSVAAEMPFDTRMAMLEAKREKSAAAEVWCLEFPRIQEDMVFRIGAPAVPIASPAPSMAFATACLAGRKADGCVKASSFGWNAEDSTAALQSALDSGARKVVVDNVGAPWIVRPIFLRKSNLEVVVADGVTVRAKKGSFKGLTDSLFTVAADVSNVVLRGEGTATLAMNKKDYQDQTQYAHAEWRHTVAISGGRDITVRDLTLLSSGGDGVYVRGAARNVRLDRLVCRDHHRQGISVISVVGLRVTNCVFDETSGTAPQCGVDLEPNTARDRLEDIVFEDCTFNGNAASGIDFFLFALDGTTPPISVTFRRCVSRGNGNCGIRVDAAGTKGPVRGTISFEDCMVSGNRQSALVVAYKRSDILPISFKNCTFDSRGGKAVPVRFDNGSYPADFGGVEFDNVRILADNDRAFSFEGVQGAGIDAGTMKGSATVEVAGDSKTVSLAEFSRAHPQNPEAMRALMSFKTVPPDFHSLAAAPGAKPLDAPATTGWFRGRFTFVQHFPAAGEYPIVFRSRPLWKGRRPGVKVQMLDATGTDLGVFEADGAVATNVVRVKGACIRRFVVAPKAGLAAVESPWPGQGVQADGLVHPYCGANRRFWFAVPADAESVRVQVRPEEPYSAKLLRPDGSVAADVPLGNRMAMLEAKREKSSAAEVWCLEFPRIEEDVYFRIGSPSIPIASPNPLTTLTGK